MERSTNSNCLYLDYNASSPLSKSVIDWFTSGDLFLGNASSHHQLGRKSLKLINQTKSFLYSLFDIDESEYQIIFHSGATEGINLFFKSIVGDYKYFCTEIDHSASFQLINHFKNSKLLNVSRSAEVNYTEIENCREASMLNIAYVNGETGFIADIEKLLDLKKQKTDLLIHLDCAQLIGKIENWQSLPKGFDAYTFSGHKFGALKGSGFSFIKKNIQLKTWLHGGNQQSDLRSGTLNEHGLYSMKLALESFAKNFDLDRLQKNSTICFDFLKDLFQEKIIFINTNQTRALNTYLFILDGIKSDHFITLCDLQNLCLSKGPACSSGSVQENRALKALGFNSNQQKSSIRLSFDPNSSKEKLEQALMVLKKTYLSMT